MRSLREEAAELLRSGYPRAELIDDLEHLRLLLRRRWGRENLEDEVLEVMDFVTGWCSPHMKL